MFKIMKNIVYLFAIIVLLQSNLACTEKKDTPPITSSKPPVDLGWEFESEPIWADEFDYSGKPNSSKWNYDIGGGGWGNNELQYYTDDLNNVSVGGGNLVITTRKEKKENRDYTSTRLVSRNKGDFLYGRIEARLKVPVGKGTWPAFWMLPTAKFYGEWPNSGEIDIMEHVGYDLNNMHISFHTKEFYFKLGNQKTAAKKIPTATTGFHKYRVDWTPYAVRGYIDDEFLIEYVNKGTGSGQWPFDKAFHLIFNTAFGGDWGGAQGVDPNFTTSQYVVDYVRVYKMIEK